MSNNKEGKQVKNSNLDVMGSIVKGYLNEEEKASIINAILHTSSHAGVEPQVRKLLESVSKALEEFHNSVEDKSIADQLTGGVVTVITFTLPLALADFISKKHTEMVEAFTAKKALEAGLGLSEMIEIAAELTKKKQNNE